MNVIATAKQLINDKAAVMHNYLAVRSGCNKLGRERDYIWKSQVSHVTLFLSLSLSPFPILQLVTKIYNARHVETSIRIGAHVWCIKYVFDTGGDGWRKEETCQQSNQFGIQRSDHPKRTKAWQPNSQRYLYYIDRISCIQRIENEK